MRFGSAVPEPPRRPVDLGQKATAAPAAPQQTAPPATPAPDEALSATSKCLAQLQQLGLRVEPGLVAAEKNEACVIDSPVQLQSWRLGDTDLEVAFPDHPVLACSFAVRFGGWVRDLAAPWMAARIAPFRRSAPVRVSCVATAIIRLVVSSAPMRVAWRWILPVSNSRTAKSFRLLKPRTRGKWLF